MKPPLDERIGGRIFFLRGRQVMLGSDLAELYEVQSFLLYRAVKRNQERFPADFMFQVNKLELEQLKSQFRDSLRSGHGGRRQLPYAFTEQEVAMLSSVLRSRRAVQVNITIMRAFVRIRRILGEHKDLAKQLKALEQKFDTRFRVVFAEIRKLVEGPEPPRRKIGFGS